MFSRRAFFKTAGLGAAVAASTRFPVELPAWAEPLRIHEPGGPALLNSNENAYGPFPSVLALSNPFQDLNRYPDHHSDVVRERLAAQHKVDLNQMLTGCGSTEILRMAAYAFTGPGRKLVMAAPTFEAAGEYAGSVQADVVRVPLASDFSHDLGAMLKAAGADAGLVYICNPNNPTGNLTRRADIEDFLRKLPQKTYVLVDEAYHEFVPAGPDYASFIDRPMGDERVIVSRTFSKIYGLAGMRLGYGVAAKDAAAQMQKHRLQDSLNIFVMRCALTAMDDSSGYRRAVLRNAADRELFMRQAASRNLKPIPSSTNFIMMPIGRPIHSLIDYFAKNNIRIGRPFPPLENYARISLGTPLQMKDFWQVWDGLKGIG
jgi:histidinol-phosphate aminotransferase